MANSPFVDYAVVVPDQACVLDWVFADGPPQQATVYDNNSRQDFHAIVPNAVPDELYWVQEEQEIYRRLQAERRLKEEEIRLKVSIQELPTASVRRSIQWQHFRFLARFIAFLGSTSYWQTSLSLCFKLLHAG